ncbi:MAG TPA: glycosyltransferase [Bacteroidales bacterium]|nr:glycosyltransferase [Bacteroidales bacterium]
MKIFVLLPRIPYPLEKGDKLRAYNQIKSLSKYNEIHLCALHEGYIHPEAKEALKPFCKSIHFIDLTPDTQIINLFLALFSKKPFQVYYFYSRKNLKRIKSIIQQIQPDRLYCQLIRTAEYVKNIPIKKTIDYQDVFSKGVERRIAHASFYFKPILKIEYKRLVRYEKEIFDLFDQKTIISYPDRELIQHPNKNEIHVIPNGVDFDYYQQEEIPKEYDLVFTGNMGYPPNINSVHFLAEKILPLVHKKNPNVKLLIAGANPSYTIVSLKSDLIHVTGWVKDLRDCYNQSKIFIAPMQIGTGLQNKLLEAMSMKIPCITSELANNALRAKSGNEILIGNNPEEYAEHILYLLNNADKAKELGENGYTFVKETYNWDSVNKELNDIICK